MQGKTLVLHIITTACVAFFFLLLFAAVAHAADTKFVPLTDFDSSAKLKDLYTGQDLASFLNKLFFGAMSLGAILAVLRLAYAGFRYMGSDFWGTKEKAKEIMQDTLLGLFLLLGIWLILNQINPGILKLRVDVEQSSQQSVQGGYPAGFF